MKLLCLHCQSSKQQHLRLQMLARWWSCVDQDNWKPQLSVWYEHQFHVQMLSTWSHGEDSTIFWITLAFEKFLGISKLKRGTNELPVRTPNWDPKSQTVLASHQTLAGHGRSPELRLLARQRNSKNSVGAELMYHVITDLQSTCNLPKSFLIPSAEDILNYNNPSIQQTA